MAVAVTNETLVLNTVNPITQDAATSSVVNATEAFTFTPTVFGNRYMILMNNPTAAQGSVTYSITAGAHWAGVAALTGSVANVVQSAIVLETGKYLSAAGTIIVTFTPATGKRLLTDHAFTAVGVQLP
jgi:hypothetical protein